MTWIKPGAGGPRALLPGGVERRGRSFQSRRLLAGTMLAVLILAARAASTDDRATADQAYPERLPSGVAPLPSGTDGAAVLYVSQHCPACRAQMAIWEELVRHREVALRLIASPTSDSDDLEWVPANLRARVQADTTGDVGRALGVRMVPLTFFVPHVEPGADVRSVAVGRLGAARITEGLRGVAVPGEGGR